ncbi:hypothetical protein HN873_036019 [Arachis hypogaea]
MNGRRGDRGASQFMELSPLEIHSECDFFADSVALAEEIWKVSKMESLEASIESAFEAIRSHGTNSHIIPSHYDVGGNSKTKILLLGQNIIFIIYIVLDVQVGEFKRLLSVKPTLKKELISAPIVTHPKSLKLPKEFDARTQWSQCSTIGRILDQVIFPFLFYILTLNNIKVQEVLR